MRKARADRSGFLRCAGGQAGAMGIFAKKKLNAGTKGREEAVTGAQRERRREFDRISMLGREIYDFSGLCRSWISVRFDQKTSARTLV